MFVWVCACVCLCITLQTPFSFNIDSYWFSLKETHTEFFNRIIIILQMLNKYLLKEVTCSKDLLWVQCWQGIRMDKTDLNSERVAKNYYKTSSSSGAQIKDKAAEQDLTSEMNFLATYLAPAPIICSITSSLSPFH